MQKTLTSALVNSPIYRLAGPLLCYLENSMPSFIDDSIALAVELQRSYSYSQRVQITVGVAALCGAYLRLVVARCSPSYASLLLLAPVVVLNVWLPLLFDQQAELLSRCVWVFLLMWLASYKVSFWWWCAMYQAT